MSLKKTLEKTWYQSNGLTTLLLPFSWMYLAVISLRRWLYKKNIKKTTHVDVPVIIVGNITVGGTGKTPLVIWLVNFLREHGYKPGVVSRGYGGKAKKFPQDVVANSDPLFVGDEPLLIARAANCPVVVDPNRVCAVKYLLANHDCNIVISDDGLQHYALGRTIEIALIDGERRFGNHYCLPAGPLREPIERLAEVDFMVTQGEALQGEYAMRLQPGAIYNLEQKELHAVPDDFAGQAVHAIAGIGYPQRFFRQLRELGITILPHAFSDHHIFTRDDIHFNDDAKVIMTAKDAVKCEAFIDYRYWCLPVTAQVDAEFGEKLLAKLSDCKHSVD